MSSEHQRALTELRKFRNQVKEFQQRLSGFPSDARTQAPHGVMLSPVRDNREAIDNTLDTLLSDLGTQEIYLQTKGAS